MATLGSALPPIAEVPPAAEFPQPDGVPGGSGLPKGADYDAELQYHLDALAAFQRALNEGVIQGDEPHLASLPVMQAVAAAARFAEVSAEDVQRKVSSLGLMSTFHSHMVMMTQIRLLSVQLQLKTALHHSLRLSHTTLEAEVHSRKAHERELLRDLHHARQEVEFMQDQLSGTKAQLRSVQMQCHEQAQLETDRAIADLIAAEAARAQQQQQQQ
jgi:hypothetical protein